MSARGCRRRCGDETTGSMGSEGISNPLVLACCPTRLEHRSTATEAAGVSLYAGREWMGSSPPRPAGRPQLETVSRGSVIPKGEGHGTYQRCSHVTSRCCVGCFIQFGKLPCFVVSLAIQMIDVPFVLVPRPAVNTCDMLGGRQGQTGRTNRDNPATRLPRAILPRGFL